MKQAFAALLLTTIFAQQAVADVCDFRPSQLIGGAATGGVVSASTATASTGVGLKAAGLYVLTHATTGATMLGSTAAGASAAGTTGIIAGSAGVMGTVGAFVMSPFVIIPAAATAVGVVAYEGGCFLAGK